MNHRTHFGSAFRRILFVSALAAASLQLWTACQKKVEAKSASSGDAAAAQVTRGKVLFMTNCIACHNANPSLDGTLGPAIKGSPLELVQARVLRGEYPAGYTPKRQTKIMQKLPLTEENVADIHAFLNAP